MTTTEKMPEPLNIVRRPRRRMIGMALVGTAAIVLLGGGAIWWERTRFRVETDDAYVRADVVTIAPRVAGAIAMVAIADNQRVAAGDLLARLDDRPYRAKVEAAQGALTSARAEVAAAQATLATIAARSDQQRHVIAGSIAARDARRAEAHLAVLEAARQAGLARQNVTSQALLQSAQAAAGRSAARVAEASATIEAARAQRRVLATDRKGALAQLDKARGAVDQARAALAAARLDLEHTVIRAPVAGTIGQRSLRRGEYVEAGTPLMALVPFTPYVVANYKETQTARLRSGQPVTITVDALDGAVFKGRVDSLAPASGAQFALLPPDNATGNFTKIVQRIPLRIDFIAGQSAVADLRPGMSVEARVDTAQTAGTGPRP